MLNLDLFQKGGKTGMTEFHPLNVCQFALKYYVYILVVNTTQGYCYFYYLKRRTCIK